MKVEVHQITKCGFFQRGQVQPLFGDAPDWKSSFGDWINARPNVAATKTFDSTEGQTGVYCAGHIADAEGYGLVLWHGMPATAQGVAYISEDASLGAVAVSERRFRQNSIPGWPSYFWILPRSGHLMSLQPKGRIRNSVNGLPMLRDYLRHYLHAFSPYVEFAVSVQQTVIRHEVREINGWRARPGDRPSTELTARFETRPMDTPCEKDVIRARVDDIRKIIHSSQVSRALPEERTRLEQALSIGGWYPGYKAPEQDRLSFRWESDWEPTVEELERLIQLIGQRETAPGRRVRTGVRLCGDPKTYWLDRASVVEEVDLPEALETASAWTPEQLQKAWMLARDQTAGDLIGSVADEAG